MSVSAHTQAVLLLTAHFSKAKDGAVKPLTPKEWGRFAAWLKERSLRPEQLLTGRLAELLNGWSDDLVTRERIEILMDRGSALALAMEKWLRAGLWIMMRSDPDYPTRFKQHLRTDSPAVLFGCGNRALLNSGGLAVIGSRNAIEDDLSYSRGLGALAAGKGYSIVSGGARGVDESSMLGALEAGGTAIGVLADSLLRACSSAKYRRYLVANNLTLISPFYPEAGFNAGNAMQWNKYVYCLSDSALVVHSGMKGGTWNGATENLKQHFWVKQTADNTTGNLALVKAGGVWVSSNINEIDFAELLKIKRMSSDSSEDLFSEIVDRVKKGSGEDSLDLPSEATLDEKIQPQHEMVTEQAEFAKSSEGDIGTSIPPGNIEFYDLFLAKA
jgi:predicted Rossmann fold nucleotide-binding protein DprA/Smf involved in DNA uptake